jgi:hypothetical protein
VKALTLTQPWATLVAIGAKRIETRSWKTSYRGPIAIHAAKAFPGGCKDLCISDAFRRGLGWPDPNGKVTQEWLDEMARLTKALPVGCVVATANIVHCIDADLIPTFVHPFTEQERAFGNYDAGRFGFLLEDVQQLAAPIPAKGALSLWEWKPELMTGSPKLQNLSSVPLLK